MNTWTSRCSHGEGVACSNCVSHGGLDSRLDVTIYDDCFDITKRLESLENRVKELEAERVE